MTSDLEALRAWQHGDGRAGKELFERYYQHVTRFFCNKVHDSARDELVQNTFLAFVEGADRFRGAASVRTYLFAIARKKLADYFTRTKPRHARETGGLDFDTVSATDLGQSPESELDSRREAQILRKALRHIPLNYQIVLELRYWEHLSDSAIAEITSMPVGTVKTRLKKGHALVRDQVKRLARSRSLRQSTLETLTSWVEGVRKRVMEPDCQSSTPVSDQARGVLRG